MPLDPPSLSHAKHADITSAPTLPLYYIPPPLGQKPERNPDDDVVLLHFNLFF